MKIFRHRNGDAKVERIALCCAAVKDQVAGDCAFGNMHGGAGGAAEGDWGGDISDGCAGDMRAVGVEVLAVDVDLATGHSGDWAKVVEMRGRRVGFVGSQKRAERGHGEV